jgi:hypothetical protein
MLVMKRENLTEALLGGLDDDSLFCPNREEQYTWQFFIESPTILQITTFLLMSSRK